MFPNPDRPPGGDDLRIHDPADDREVHRASLPTALRVSSSVDEIRRMSRVALRRTRAPGRRCLLGADRSAHRLPDGPAGPRRAPRSAARRRRRFPRPVTTAREPPEDSLQLFEEFRAATVGDERTGERYLKIRMPEPEVVCASRNRFRRCRRPALDSP
jgi:hypothetical protein